MDADAPQDGDSGDSGDVDQPRTAVEPGGNEGENAAVPTGADVSNEDVEPKRPATPRGVPAFWETYKKGLVPAAIVLVLAQAWTPVGGFIFDVLDEVRDVGRGFIYGLDAAEVDDMKEQVEDQDYWADGDPEWFGESLHFTSDQGNVVERPLVSTDSISGEPTILTPEQLLRKAPEYDGEPMILVGEVIDSRSLGGDSVDLVTNELRLIGSDPKLFVIVGFSPFGDDGPDVGEFGAFPGIVVASGRVRLDTGQTLKTVYFVAHEPFEDPAPPISGALHDLGSPAP